MNLPGVKVDLPTISEKDRVGFYSFKCRRRDGRDTDFFAKQRKKKVDIVDFAVKHKMDMIAASFVRKAKDIDVIRQVCGERGSMIKIIAKIENQEGLENFDEIIKKADGVGGNRSNRATGGRRGGIDDA